MKNIITIIVCVFVMFGNAQTQKDTTKSIKLDEIVITSQIILVSNPPKQTLDDCNQQSISHP